MKHKQDSVLELIKTTNYTRLPALLLHPRQPDQPNRTMENDEVTVVTSNSSPCNSTSDWTTVGSSDAITQGELRRLPHVVPPAEITNVPTRNYFQALTMEEDTGLDTRSIAVDSGASANFGDTNTPGTARHITPTGIVMASATGDCKTSIGIDRFHLPLPPSCLDYHVFNQGDVQRPLLSVGKVCDTGCVVLFTKDGCYFFKDRKILLQGLRDTRSGLYLLPHSSRDHQPLKAYSLTTPYRNRATDAYTLPNLMRYLHGCAGFPISSTWMEAIRLGYFMGWPGLTASRVRRYLPKSEVTALGHLKLIRQGVRSTSSKGDSPTSTTKGVEGEESHSGERRTSQNTGRRRNIMVCSTSMKELKELRGIVGTDQTGRFPVVSDRGHKYLFIMFDEDVNYIQGIPIKSRKTAELIRAFEEGYSDLKRCGFEPVLHRIDNETSKELETAIREKKLEYETVPPGNHRRNPAERAIQTFKSHFISILNGIDENYPEGAWDYLIPQTNMTLNMLRPCTINDAHSAYAFINGPYDFNAHPLAPLGCRAVVHQRASGRGGKRGGWGNRGKIGYYVGPVMHSYRVWAFYMPETNAIQETDTAEFFPSIPLPTTTIETEIADSLDRIEVTLEELKPPHTEVLKSAGQNDTIRRLRDMYGNSAPRTQGASKERDPAALPRVKEAHKKLYNGINRYRPKKKQRFPTGTRVRVIEKVAGKRTDFLGKATEYDPYTGLYHITFDDGEYEEFDDDEMAYFRLVKGHTPRAPSTLTANQICIPGFFPKCGATAAPVSCYNADTMDNVLHGLNAGSIYDEELHKWMSYRDLIKHPNPKIRRRWERAGLNEFARLAQGYDGVEGMNVVTFIAKSDLPTNKEATYARYVVDYRPEKDEPWRLRITCGGDRLEYVGNTTTHSASMETIKCQLNSIISTPKAKAATADISNMYLGSDLPEPEYVRFRLSLIPDAFIEAYGLRSLATADGYVYARVNKAWYGLKQAGKIAHDDLVNRLAAGGYKKAALVEGYFYHETRNISFTLVVDDFLIKYERDEDLQHLQATIEAHYKLKIDPEATQYVGIHLRWDYVARTVRLSMNGYVQQALLEFEHQAPAKPCYSPSRYSAPVFGSKVQFAKVDETAPLGKDKITFIQQVVGKLLYYARAVDPTMLHAINDISLSASKGTDATLDATMYLLNYAHTNPNSEVIYRASDMILRVDSDAAYLVAPEARSRAGGYQYLSDKEGTVFNGPVLVLAKVIKNVMASATEAELAALFMNAQEAVGIRNCLEAMGFPQPATPMKTDNSTANGILNNTMKQKRSKAIDVRFYWLRDRAEQGQFFIYWDAGRNNLADFYTKHHPPCFHRRNRPIHSFVEGKSPERLQGCIRMMNDVQTKPKTLSLLAVYPHLMTQVKSLIARVDAMTHYIV